MLRVLILCLNSFMQWYLVHSTNEFTITGFFEYNDTLSMESFVFAVEEVNNNTSSVKLKPIIINFSTFDASNATQQVCDSLLDKSVAIFGPKSSPSKIQMLADLKEIPYFETDFTSKESGSFSLYPSTQDIGAAIADLIQFRKWQSFVILCEAEEGSLLQSILNNMKKSTNIAVRTFPEDGMYLELIKEVVEIIEETQVVILADLKISERFLMQITESNSSMKYAQFIFSDVDMYTLNLELYKLVCNNCTFSGIKIVQQNEQMDRLNAHLQTTAHSEVSTIDVPTAAAVTYDSVMVLARALENNAAHIKAQRVSCHSDQIWSSGTELMEAIKQVEYSGITGDVQFDSSGQRNSVLQSVVDLTNKGYIELGSWDEKNQLEMNENKSLRGSPLRVTLVIEEPWVMLKADESLTGNDRYEGYCIDLLKKLSEIVGFDYEIHEVADHAYGAMDEKGVWNGMVGALVRKEADIAVAQLTISKSRSEVISFTVPFVQAGLSILYKKPVKKDPSLFTVLSPLSLEVWLCILAAYVTVSLALSFVGRFSPYEWFKPITCSPKSVKIKNKFTLMDSFWFMVGSLMQQGYDITPKAPSTRLLTSFWWFFTLIIIASYTANLAAFLTVQRMVLPIKNADDLSRQTKIKYGLTNNTAQMVFFNVSKIDTYEKMWEFMQATDGLVENDAEGLRRVVEEDYAYLTDSPSIEYYTARNCSLMQVGGLLDSKGLGFGLQKDSIYVDAISSTILALQEQAVLAEIKDIWWKKDGQDCEDNADDDNASAGLKLPSVVGAFVLLAGGIVVCLLVLIFEHIYSILHSKLRKQYPGKFGRKGRAKT